MFSVLTFQTMFLFFLFQTIFCGRNIPIHPEVPAVEQPEGEEGQGGGQPGGGGNGGHAFKVKVGVAAIVISIIV
jgi:hypothetical protein